MHLAAPSNFLTQKHRQFIAGPRGTSRHSAEVINAYIAIRDRLTDEVEKIVTPEKLNRLSIVNDLVVACLKPARNSYEGPCLPESEAARERRHCEAVRMRLAELGALVAKVDWR